MGLMEDFQSSRPGKGRLSSRKLPTAGTVLFNQHR